MNEEKKSTFSEIKEEIDLTNNNLRFHLKKLQDVHIVTQTRGRGPYKITDLGKTLLEFFKLLEKQVKLN